MILTNFKVRKPRMTTFYQKIFLNIYNKVNNSTNTKLSRIENFSRFQD